MVMTAKARYVIQISGEEAEGLLVETVSHHYTDHSLVLTLTTAMTLLAIFRIIPQRCRLSEIHAIQHYMKILGSSEYLRQASLRKARKPSYLAYKDPLGGFRVRTEHFYQHDSVSTNSSTVASQHTSSTSRL